MLLNVNITPTDFDQRLLLPGKKYREVVFACQGRLCIREIVHRKTGTGDAIGNGGDFIQESGQS